MRCAWQCCSTKAAAVCPPGPSAGTTALCVRVCAHTYETDPICAAYWMYPIGCAPQLSDDIEGDDVDDDEQSGSEVRPDADGKGHSLSHQPAANCGVISYFVTLHFPHVHPQGGADGADGGNKQRDADGGGGGGNSGGGGGASSGGDDDDDEDDDDDGPGAHTSACAESK